MEQLIVDINSEVLNGISDFDLGVWGTPEGTTFVDGQCPALTRIINAFPDVVSSVLSSKDQRSDNKGKDHQIAKWEEEVRKSLAAKNAATTTLSRQQEMLVKQQLEKEAKIRQRVREVRTRLVRGLYFIRSVVAAHVEEIQAYMSPIVTLLLEGALGPGSFLVGSMVFETYLVCFLFCLPVCCYLFI